MLRAVQQLEVYSMLVGVDGSEGNIVPPFSLIPLPGITHHIPIIFPGKMLCAGFSSDFSFIFPLTVLNVHPIVQCPQNTFPTLLNLNIIHGKSMNPVPPSLSPVVVFACQFKGGGPLSLAPHLPGGAPLHQTRSPPSAGVEAAFGIKVGFEFPSQPLNTLCRDLIWWPRDGQGSKDFIFADFVGCPRLFSSLEVGGILWFKYQDVCTVCTIGKSTFAGQRQLDNIKSSGHIASLV